MKRLLGIILCVAFIFSSVGCSVQDTKGNAEIDTIVENTSNTDEPSNTNDNTFALNTKYLSYMGKSKDFIDGECGDKGEHSSESGGVTYRNGLIVGFDTTSVSEKPQSNNIATSLNIKLEDLFFNCPQTVTFEQIKSVFDDAMTIYDEYTGGNIIIANYRGNLVFFSYGLERGKYATIKNEPYESLANSGASEDTGNLTGRYIPDEAVPGSYIEIKKNGTEYFADIFLVRAINLENAVCKVIDKNKMTFSSKDYGDEIVGTIEWSDDYRTMTISSDNEFWKYTAAEKYICHKQ